MLPRSSGECRLVSEDVIFAVCPDQKPARRELLHVTPLDKYCPIPLEYTRTGKGIRDDLKAIDWPRRDVTGHGDTQLLCPVKNPGTIIARINDKSIRVEQPCNLLERKSYYYDTCRCYFNEVEFA